MEHKEGEMALAEVMETKETKEGAELSSSLPMASEMAGNNLISERVRTF
jgi:hypothetical protein